MCGLHEEEAMWMGISGDALIPAKRTERANIMRCAHVGESTGALEISRGGRARADTEFLKNTINIDKYTKRYMEHINKIFDIYSISCLCNRK